MKNAGKARSYGLYRHLRTSKEIIENLLNYFIKYLKQPDKGAHGRNVWRIREKKPPDAQRM